VLFFSTTRKKENPMRKLNWFDRLVRRAALVAIAIAAISLYVAESKLCTAGISSCPITSPGK